jgi:hypothetical protein
MEDDIPDDETPPNFDADAVIERWEEIKERGHPLGPECSADTGTEHSGGDES